MKNDNIECQSFTNTNMASLLNKDSKSNVISKKNDKFQTIVEGNLWIVDDFLTKDECERLIEKIEDLGFHEATLNIGYNKQIIAKNVRDCKRCMIDDYESAELIKSRIINILPFANQGGVLSSVNERFRFLKYSPGNEFKTHMDGRFSRTIRNYEETSVFTMHIYLNESSKGGETIFYDDKFFENGMFYCEPKRGRLAIFRQYGFLHCGAPVTEGIKYTVRSDIMYRKLEKSDLLNDKIAEIKCGMCESDLFYKHCRAGKEKVPSCKCSHIYGNSFERFPCIFCQKSSSFSEIDDSKCLLI